MYPVSRIEPALVQHHLARYLVSSIEPTMAQHPQAMYPESSIEPTKVGPTMDQPWSKFGSRKKNTVTSKILRIEKKYRGVTGSLFHFLQLGAIPAHLLNFHFSKFLII